MTAVTLAFLHSWVNKDWSFIIIQKNGFSKYTFGTLNKVPNHTKRHHLGVNKMAMVKYPRGKFGGRSGVKNISMLTSPPKNTIILSRRGTLELRVHWLFLETAIFTTSSLFLNYYLIITLLYSLYILNVHFRADVTRESILQRTRQSLL